MGYQEEHGSFQCGIYRLKVDSDGESPFHSACRLEIK